MITFPFFTWGDYFILVLKGMGVGGAYLLLFYVLWLADFRFKLLHVLLSGLGCKLG